ncbi:MAG: DUF2934 domain-containing protein [Terracidiphilus sp.]|jgi:hypothetical protein
MAKSVKKSGAAHKAAAKPSKPAAKKTVASAKANGTSTSHDQVAQLAHRFWTERGQTHGHHEEDWFRAEQALRSKAS